MGLTHFDEEGKAVMVDVTNKEDTVREAAATGKIQVSPEVYEAIRSGTVGKGDVLGMATTAGIMGAKRTAELIPMCHPVQVEGIDLIVKRVDVCHILACVVSLVVHTSEIEGETAGCLDIDVDGAPFSGVVYVVAVEGGTAFHEKVNIPA